MVTVYKFSHRRLRNKKRRQEDKFLILLSNQIVIIDTEWDGMKRARKHGKPVVEMIRLSNRNRKLEITSLNKLLEQNGNEFKEKIDY